MSELEEEQGGEEDAFSEARTEAPEGKEGKVTRALVISRLKEMEHDKDANGEAAVLNDWLKLANEEADLKKRVKDVDADLDVRAYQKYAKLTEAEIHTLVVEDKWLAALDVAVQSEMDRISQALTHRVRELVERYETPMPQMVSHVTELEGKVNRHLESMGFAW